MDSPRIFQLIPNYQPYDAVGNDVLGMHRFLREAGYDARVLAGDIHPEYVNHASPLAQAPAEFWEDARAIVIYHHSIDWGLAEKILRGSKNRIIVKYHNVTPPEFFAPYAENYYHACALGLEATRRIAGLRIDFVWGASQYNADEFRRLGVPADRCRVMPPIHNIEDLARAPLDAVATGTYRGQAKNILFVGAFRPNKGHLKALEVFAAYRRLSARDSRLFFVGSFDPALQRYVSEIEECALSLGVEESVSYAMSVSPSRMRSYYHLADVFLCVSEHEGFCVPLVEAMYFRAPIVAWASTAVGETCDGCGMIYPEFDAQVLARAIDACLEDPILSRDLTRRGRLRYETVFHPDAIRERFLSLVKEVEQL